MSIPELRAAWLLGLSLFASTCLAAARDVQADAESALFDGIKGQVEYNGHARLFNQNVNISSDTMQLQQNEDGSVREAHLYGNPARLVHTDPQTAVQTRAEARHIYWSPVSGKIELEGAVKLQQDDSRNQAQTEINAEQIQLVESGNSISEMQASGSPSKFQRKQADNPAYSGQANAISYRAQGELLLLQGKASLTRGDTTIEHEEIRYDGVNKRTEARKIDGKRVHFMRRQDEAGATPVDTPPPLPLTPNSKASDPTP